MVPSPGPDEPMRDDLLRINGDIAVGTAKSACPPPLLHPLAKRGPNLQLLCRRQTCRQAARTSRYVDSCALPGGVFIVVVVICTHRPIRSVSLSPLTALLFITLTTAIAIRIPTTNTHIMPHTLPAIGKLTTLHRAPVARAPYSLPDPFAHDAHGFGPVFADFLVELGGAGCEFVLGELGGVAGWPRNEVGVAHAVAGGEAAVLGWGETVGCEAGGVEEFPEEVGRVRVGVAGEGGADAGVGADEDAD